MRHFAGWKTNATATLFPGDAVTQLPKRKRRGLNPETQLQIDVVNWFGLVFPAYHPVLFASAGGLKTSVVSGKIMQRMGYKAGTPDLFLAVPRGDFHGLFIEVKTHEGRPSPAQREVIANVQAHGYYAEICCGFDRIVDVFTQYLNLKNT